VGLKYCFRLAKGEFSITDVQPAINRTKKRLNEDCNYSKNLKQLFKEKNIKKNKTS